MKKIKALIIILISLIILLFMTNIVYAEQTDNVETTGEILDELENEALISSDVFIEYGDDPFIQELKMLSDALSKTISKIDEIPDISNHKLIVGFNIANEKVVDVTETEAGELYAIFYTADRAYKFDGSTLLNFFYECIYKASDINLENS